MIYVKIALISDLIVIIASFILVVKDSQWSSRLLIF